MIALVANFTVESLSLRVRKQADTLTLPGFDTWQAEFLNPASVLWRDEVKTIYLLLHGPALFPDGADADFEKEMSEPLSVLEQARTAHPDKLFVASTLDLPSSAVLPLTGRDFARRAAGFWQDELERMGVPVLNIAELAANMGRERFYSAKMWYFGSLPFSQQGETALVQEITRIENVILGKRKKCLVLDLDNTLWGGVIGEDGLENLELSESGMGSRYRDAQRIVKKLSEQGILLAIASKNNLEDALLPFREHPHMILREENFIAVKANWNPKPDSILEIAQELNIGLDSLVFIDDNPLEREAVKSALPEVAVPDFPADTAQLPAFMAEMARTYFGALRIGKEDLQKTEMYRAESQREAIRKTHRTLEEYLASLAMKLDLHRLRRDEIARAAQLTQKTNQFNLTTRRYTEADIGEMLEDDLIRVWTAELRDRFGDYGRVCLVIVRLNPPHAATVDTFLMSCRVMGRGVEEAVLSDVERELAEEGVSEIRGEFRPTPKNRPILDFWSRMGYLPEGDIWLLRAPFVERKTNICPIC